MRTQPYQWIVDRARSGEPVAIETDRWDMSRIIDFLLSIDGRGLAMQSDYEFGLLWIVRKEAG